MKSIDEWGQVYLDELGRVMELNDPDVHPGSVALTKVIEGVRRETAEDMRKDILLELVQIMYITYGMSKNTIGELLESLRSLPLLGDE